MTLLTSRSSVITLGLSRLSFNVTSLSGGIILSRGKYQSATIFSIKGDHDKSPNEFRSIFMSPGSLCGRKCIVSTDGAVSKVVAPARSRIVGRAKACTYSISTVFTLDDRCMALGQLGLPSLCRRL